MHRSEQIFKELSAIDGVYPGKGEASEKHLKMATNPFRFFRGSASLFYLDLANDLLQIPAELTQTIPMTTIVGDCHVSNFGFFTEEGSHGDKVIFAPNDFDDACIGNPIHDLLRFSCSLKLTQSICEGIVAGEYESEELEDVANLKNASPEGAINAIRAFLSAYVAQCQKIIDNETNRYKVLAKFSKGHILQELEKKAQKRAFGGKNFKTKSALAKATTISDSNIRFNIELPRFETIEPDVYQEIIDTFAPYVDDSIVDVVRRLGAGTGSVNMDRYYLLVGPKDYDSENSLYLYHVVEVKQQRHAAPLVYFGEVSPVNSLNPAHLTAVCQRQMQRRPDLVLDEVEWRNQHWLIRSRHHAKVGISPEYVGLAQEAPDKKLEQYAHSCGSALALAHSRGDRRSVLYEQAICKYLPSAMESLCKSALRYASRVDIDCAILRSELQS